MNMWNRDNWKSEKNTTISIIPSWSAPFTTDEINNMDGPLSAWGKPAPIRHWRKQLKPRQKREGYSNSSVGMPIDIPTIQVPCSSNSCESYQLINNMSTCEKSKVCDYGGKCKNVIKSGMVKRIPNYNETLSKYLEESCKSYSKNIGVADISYNSRKCDIVRLHNNCKKTIIYKPSNVNSSGSRIGNYKYNKVTTYNINNYTANSASNNNFGNSDGKWNSSILLNNKYTPYNIYHKKGRMMLCSHPTCNKNN